MRDTKDLRKTVKFILAGVNELRDTLSGDTELERALFCETGMINEHLNSALDALGDYERTEGN